MVTSVRRAARRLAIALLAVASWPAYGEVVAEIDRPAVDLNESFVLRLQVDTAADIEPDWTALDEAFYRDTASYRSDTTILNGVIQRSITWSIPLMAKATGTQTIPAVTVGNEKSNPLTITINEPQVVPPGEADVFVTSEIDQQETYVQAQVLYRIKVYRAVATRQPALREPAITGAESLFERAGEERAYQSILNGKAYNVVERVIAIYPQESGVIEIPAARFEARVLKDGRITGRKTFESQPHTVTVLPVPPPPDGFPHATWLPARDVTLSEEWSREPDRMKAGEPVTRHITITALGQLETQIPAIEPPEVDGVNVYADKPDLSRSIEAHGIRGRRKDQYAMIGVRGGEIEIPPLEVPWWDLERGEWRVARLDGRTLHIEAAEVVPVQPEPALAQEAPATESATPAIADRYWKKATQLLLLVWLLTLAAWWWSSRERQQDTRTPPPPPLYKQQAKLLKAARKAAAAGDKPALRQALLDWAALEWPTHTPRSVGALAERVAEPVAGELRRLSAVSYGADGIEWNGQALADALRTMRALNADDAEANLEILPPLMPPLR